MHELFRQCAENTADAFVVFRQQRRVAPQMVPVVCESSMLGKQPQISEVPQ